VFKFLKLFPCFVESFHAPLCFVRMKKLRKSVRINRKRKQKTQVKSKFVASTMPVPVGIYDDKGETAEEAEKFF